MRASATTSCVASVIIVIVVVLGVASVSCSTFTPAFPEVDASAQQDGASGVDGGPVVDGAADGASDAKPRHPGLMWEANALGEWKLSNHDGTTPQDCCGGTTGACSNFCDLTSNQNCDNPIATAISGGTVVFSSGPPIPTEQSHRTDGFFAVWKNILLESGAKYHVAIRIVSLSAISNNKYGGETDQYPRWLLAARDGSTFLGKIGGSWATVKCISPCSGVTSDFTEYGFDFTASSDSVELVLSAMHHCSQCDAIVSDVAVGVDYVRVTKL